LTINGRLRLCCRLKLQRKQSRPQREAHAHVPDAPSRRGTQTSNLTITYQNNNWWNYKVFTTALVPQGARLLDARYTSPSTGPFVTDSAGLTTLSSQIVVPPHTTANVTYSYTVPATVGSGGVFSHYTLYVQKQAGIDQYTLNTAVTFPQGAQLVHESNVGSETGVTGDVQAEVIYRYGAEVFDEITFDVNRRSSHDRDHSHCSGLNSQHHAPSRGDDRLNP